MTEFEYFQKWFDERSDEEFNNIVEHNHQGVDIRIQRSVADDKRYFLSVKAIQNSLMIYVGYVDADGLTNIPYANNDGINIIPDEWVPVIYNFVQHWYDSTLEKWYLNKVLDEQLNSMETNDTKKKVSKI